MRFSLDTHGFPTGYFLVRSLATNKLLDVEANAVDDGTEIILYPEQETSLVDDLRDPESDNQVFFMDPTGALCSRSSGHAIDVEDGGLVLRHRRTITHPFPNSYSHLLPRFSYSESSGEIYVSFDPDTAYPSASSPKTGASAIDPWKDNSFVLSSIPMRKSKTLIDNASSFFASAISTPLSFLSGADQAKSTPEEVFGTDIDLNEDEIMEQDRGEEGEVDDSLDPLRRVRVLAVTDESDKGLGEKAKRRRQWEITPLRETRKKSVKPQKSA